MLPVTTSGKHSGKYSKFQLHSPQRPRSLLQTAIQQLRVRYSLRIQRWLKRNVLYVALLAVLAITWALFRFLPHARDLPSLKRHDLQLDGLASTSHAAEFDQPGTS